MLHCVDASTGAPQWRAPGISEFAAVSKSRVYGVDRYGTIHILNIKDGATVGLIPTGGVLNALVNDQTDRLFLISENGLVECLHEIGADKPTYYAKSPAAAKEGEKEGEGKEEYQGDGQPATTPVEAPAVKPATPPAAAPTDSGNPFGEPAAASATPAEESDFGTGDENPFQ